MDRYEPFCKTKRFDIFHHRVVRNPDVGLPRDVYTAWFHSEDVPKPVCVVTLFDWSAMAENKETHIFVDWAEVTDDWRRKGIATEVLHALQAKLGPLTVTGATEAGEAFADAWEKHTNATN